MIIPSIDLQSGNAVQLVGGEKKALDAGDPVPIAERFSLAGEIAVIDLDAALGQGSNESVIRSLISRFRCRVGGGIRNVASAVEWLDRGAAKIIVGTKAEPELLRELPRNRLLAALDARDGDVVVEGWTKATGRTVLSRIAELRDYVDGFLITFVEKEGRMGGTRMDLVKELVEAAGPARVTIAGGVTTAAEIAELDRLGADAQVGMALYTNSLQLADAIAAPLTSDRSDGLWPTLVCDERGNTLGLAWSSPESLRAAVDERAGIYCSRKRGLWRKGGTSGATQELLGIDLDCDRDAIRFRVRQRGSGFCHNGTATCFGESRGLSALEALLKQRLKSAPPGSYAARLYSDSALLSSKIEEEGRELAKAESAEETVAEAADVMFFAMTKLAAKGLSLADVERELDRRNLKVTRRPGDAKPATERS